MSTKDKEKSVFVLDIGTRSVIGVLGKQQGDLFRVEDTQRLEHRTRAVVDGQIEDITKTAEIAREVKERIEQKTGQSLSSVYIAAAGRVLRTVRTQCEAPVEEDVEIDDDFVARLERTAVQNAYKVLAGEQDAKENYFCVGYSVQKYLLDDYEFQTLIGHKGKLASASLIVTFLPKEVVDSLYATMSRIGLTVSGLTLEPIAAMNAIIPPELRKLNLALCDIGAGTSDIAVCENGSVKAYTVATVAGDEITEAIMRECLVDFDTAETIKRTMSDFPKETVKYQNILGFDMEESAEIIYNKIDNEVQALAKIIGERILEANGHAPAAVFLVGGGSKTPKLREKVAKALELSVDTVAVGGSVYIKKLFVSDFDLQSPDFATPLGIAITAVTQNGSDAFCVTINGDKLHLFNIWDNSVLGVLQMGGYRYNQIIGRNGRAVNYELNGMRRTVYGGLTEPATIKLNGESASITDTVHPGDTIEFEPAVPGEDAEVIFGDLAALQGSIRIKVEGEVVLAGTYATLNGEPASASAHINSGDSVEICSVDTLGQLVEKMYGDPLDYDMFVNGRPRSDGYLLCDKDEVSVVKRLTPRQAPPEQPKSEPQPKPQPERKDQSEPVKQESPPVEQPSAPEAEHSVPSEPDEPKPTPEPPARTKGIKVTLNGKTIELPYRGAAAEYQFFDLLGFADIDTKKPNGTIVQLLNDSVATYSELIRDGDVAQIYWSNEMQ